MEEKEKAVVAPHVDQQQKEFQEQKENAEDILKNYCKMRDERKVDEIVEKVAKYIKDKKSRKLSEITGDEKRLINDAIHGPIELPPLIYQIINTEEFHRLKYLKQLGGAHYVYPGANHTRFEHSIGVYHIAGVFARSLQNQWKLDREIAKKDDNFDEKLYEFYDEEVLCAEIAGLCHDLGHGPMSHMFESVMKESCGSKVKHEGISVSMFKRLLTHHEVLGEFVHKGLTHKSAELVEHMICPPKDEQKNIIRKDGRHFLYEIVANKKTGIDVDKWDYYQRDCHYLGILQDFEWRRTMLLGRIIMTTNEKGQKELHVGFRDKEMDNLYGMFRTRANLYRKACKHKTVKAVERMFIDAMDLVTDLRIVWASESDTGSSDKERFKSIKEAVELATDKEPKLDWYMSMTDSIVDVIKSAKPTDCQNDSEPRPVKAKNDSETKLAKLEVKKDSETRLAEAKNLLTRLAKRDIYKCVAKKKVSKLFDAHVEKEKTERQADTYSESDVDVRTAQYLLKEVENRRSFGKRVYEHLSQMGQTNFKEEHLLVEVIDIKHPSEGEGNPLDKVVFFEKPEDPHSLPQPLTYKEAREKVSMVMVPQAFVEYEVRVYDTCCKDERSEHSIDPKEVKKAMDEAWKDLRPTVIHVHVLTMEEETRKKTTKSNGESPVYIQGSGTGNQHAKRVITKSISDDNSECPPIKKQKC